MVRRGPVGLVVTITMALLLVVGLPARSATAAPAADPDAAVAWLLRHDDDLDLTSRIHRTLALEVAGAPTAHVTAALRQVEFLVGETSIHAVESDDLAEAVVAVSMSGADPHHTSAGDLVAELDGRLGRPPLDPGQVSAGHGHELTAQAWTVLALARVGTVPPRVLDHLVSRQCPDGTFDPDPVYGCKGHPNLADQAMVLTALVAQQGRSPQSATAISRLVTWFDKALASPADVPVTAAARLVQPLRAWGDDSGANRAEAIVGNLQVHSAPYPGLAGAVGAETPDLLKDLESRRLLPSPDLTSAGILAMRPVDLSQYRYRPAAPRRGTPPLPMQIVLSRSSVTAGATTKLLVTGAAPRSPVTVTSPGLRNSLGTGRTDRDGVSRVTVATSGLDAGQTRLRVSDGQGHAGATLTIAATSGGSSDSTSRRGGLRADEGQWPRMSTGRTARFVLAVVAVLTLAAIGLRRR